MYWLLFAISPWIAVYFDEPVLCVGIRVLSLSVIVGAVSTIQNSILAREMRFDASFKAGLISTLVSGAVGVGMAYCDYGIWALIGLALSAQCISAFVLWALLDWRPRFMFSVEAINKLFSFGSKLYISGLLETIFSNLYNLIIGKLFTTVTLGYYSRGQSIPNFIMSSSQGVISSVIFPVLASCQSDKNQVKNIVRRTVQGASFIVFPMMLGMVITARPLLLVFLGERWLPSVPYLQLACIACAFWPLHVINLQAVNALGRSDIFLRLEIIKKTLLIGIILVTFRYGVMAMVAGQVFFSMICTVINAWPNRRLLDYSITQQGWDLLPISLLAVSVCVPVMMLDLVITNVFWLLSAQIIVFLICYFGGAVLFKLESAGYLWLTLQQYYRSRYQSCT